jgi:uncharacterized membrane-anchored protein
MAQLAIGDYPDRFRLANELHARPFPVLEPPTRAVLLAIKEPEAAADRDRTADLAHLTALLDRFGAPHPPPGANHYSGPLGRAFLKWEMHTEFVTYTLFSSQIGGEPFSDETFALLPRDWLAQTPGKLVTSCILWTQTATPAETKAIVERDFPLWFDPESLAASRVSDGEAVVGADFRIDASGHTRFAVLAKPSVDRHRLGRIVQRLFEIEVYKSMSMLALPQARSVAASVARIDRNLTDSVNALATGGGNEAETLQELLAISAEIELLSSTTAFRFGAAEAYAALVDQRIEVLREDRIADRQLFGEFMRRRYDPAMRTCLSAKQRLDELAARAARAANLLRTRVDVANQAQSTEVLHQMDRRAAMQLRLQETVEGLSVVAISYYAVNLVATALGPLAGTVGVDKGHLAAFLTVPVVLLVWFMVRRIRARIARREAGHER